MTCHCHWFLSLTLQAATRVTPVHASTPVNWKITAEKLLNQSCKIATLLKFQKNTRSVHAMGYKAILLWGLNADSTFSQIPVSPNAHPFILIHCSQYCKQQAHHAESVKMTDQKYSGEWHIPTAPKMEYTAIRDSNMHSGLHSIIPGQPQ